MTIHSNIEAHEVRFEDAFNALSDRDALRLLKSLAERFSGLSYGFDKVDHGLSLIAIDLAEQEDWRGEDLAARYLADSRIPPAYERHVMVSDAAFYGKQFGG